MSKCGKVALSSAEAPAGYRHQNINNRKNRKRAGDVPHALSFSFSPASPQHKEASAEERGKVVKANKGLQ